MSLTRTMKFEVEFADLRKADQLKLHQRLRSVQTDLTRAANRVISALWMLRIGQLPPPLAEKGAHLGKPVPLQTLAYQGMNGTWRPFGHPCYQPPPGAPTASGGVISETANGILTRIKEDAAEVDAGQKSLPTFRELPIAYRNTEVELRADGAIELVTFGGRQNNRVVVRPRKIDRSQTEILNRCRSGEYKHGSARLQCQKRGGARDRWFLSLSWTNQHHEVSAVDAEAPETVIAGVDTGIHHAAWIAFTNINGEPLKRPGIIAFPSRTLRGVVRITKERRERLQYNRAALGLREGRGRERKLRVVDALGDKVQRMNETMVEQIAAATIAACKARGATLVVIEDHTRWSVDSMHAEGDAASTRSEAARIRATYFRWHQGAMRVALLQVGQREGLQVIGVDPGWTSRTCHECGTVHNRDWLKYPLKAGETTPHYGRIALRHFVCSCGYRGHADHNAAINIARRGIDFTQGTERWTTPSSKAKTEKVAAKATAKSRVVHTPREGAPAK